MCSKNHHPLFVKLDVVKYFPLCRVNRGENDEQKVFKRGGSDRALISSQKLRRYLREKFGLTNCSLEEVMREVKSPNTDNNKLYILDEKEIVSVLEDYVGYSLSEYLQSDSNMGCFISAQELKEAAIAAQELKKTNAAQDKEKTKNKGTKKSISDLMPRVRNTVVDLFGRMYAGSDALTVESAVKADMAKSIEDVTPYRDYFTLSSTNVNRKGAIHCNNDRTYTEGLFYFCVTLDIGMLLDKGYSKEKLGEITGRLIKEVYNLNYDTGVSGTNHYTLPVVFGVSVSSNPNNLPNYFGLFYTPIDPNRDLNDISSEIKSKINCSVDNINKKVENFSEDPSSKVWYKFFSEDCSEYKETLDYITSCIPECL